jgi:hypothetical protein
MLISSRKEKSEKVAFLIDTVRDVSQDSGPIRRHSTTESDVLGQMCLSDTLEFEGTT